MNRYLFLAVLAALVFLVSTVFGQTSSHDKNFEETLKQLSQDAAKAYGFKHGNIMMRIIFLQLC